VRRALLWLVLGGAACGGEEDFDALVEPAIVQLVPSDAVHGTFVLTLYLEPDAGATAEVWLHQLAASGLSQVTAVATDVAFPVELEPGRLVRVPFAYELAQGGCQHELTGHIFDSLTDELTPVSSAGAFVPTGPTCP
jgi:hypothetical protein